MQMRDGLRSTLEFQLLLSGYPSALWKLLAFESRVTLTSDYLLDLFTPQLSEVGTNDRETEKLIMYNFCTFLEEVENGMHSLTMEQILAFITGASSPPPAGFSPKPHIRFSDPKRLPHNSTCLNCLYLPRDLTSFDYFVERMTVAILGCSGFGLV